MSMCVYKKIVNIYKSHILRKIITSNHKILIEHNKDNIVS